MSKNLVKKAVIFAKKAHETQVRKYTGAPYFTHCANVVNILIRYGYDDEEMICAAYLHDTVEDTDTTIEDIELAFGFVIGQYVSDLTDVSKPEDGNRVVRKQIDREHTWRSCDKSQIIKMADLIDNTGSIAKHDKEFARVYINEKLLLLKGMSNVVKKEPIYEEALKIALDLKDKLS